MNYDRLELRLRNCAVCAVCSRSSPRSYAYCTTATSEAFIPASLLVYRSTALVREPGNQEDCCNDFCAAHSTTVLCVLSLAFWAALITVWRDRGVDRIITRRFFHYFLFPFCFFLFRLIAFFFPLPTSQAARAPWGHPRDKCKTARVQGPVCTGRKERTSQTTPGDQKKR